MNALPSNSKPGLHVSEAAFAESAPVMLWMGDANGKCVYLNKRQCAFWGIRQEDTGTFDWNTTLHPDDRETLYGPFGRAMQAHTGFIVEARYRRADGEWRILETQAEPRFDASGAFIGMVGVNTDITDRKAADEALRRAKEDRDFIFSLAERQRALTDPDAIMRMTTEAVARHMKANRAGFYRVADETVLTFGPDWTDGTIAPVEGTSLHTDTLGEGYNRMARAGGSIVSDDSQVRGDIGEQAGRYGARAGIASPMLRQGKWTSGFFVSSATTRHWTPEEIAIVEEIAETSWDNVERAQAEAALRVAEARSREELERLVNERTAAWRAAEEQLRQSQKMEAVGQLTGGIAHDFNNMLAVVIGGLNLLQRRLARGDTDVAKYVDAAMEGATRAAALTQRLLSFSRQKSLAPEPVDANQMIDGMIELLGRTLGEHIRIETVQADDLWKTNVDATELQSAVLNLSVNARDAMPDGGRLTITTANVEIGGQEAIAYQIAGGEYVLIAVADTGTGMAPEVIARAFDPFFTTKAVGKGTGLGLSQVFGFIRQSGGHVKIDSKVGEGTTLRIFLPRFAGDAVPLTAKDAANGVPGAKAGETVMVVEDDERVRNYSAEALRELGYGVTQAANGREALKLIEGGARVTLLFSDMVMPEMTGRELVRRTAQIQPGVKVLYTTGYAPDGVMADPGAIVLQKPFSIEQLATKVRSAIDA
jgi:PAS domain S-box-containing protein